MIADKPIASPGRWRAAAGFTLLEVTIAIGIMATVLVILFGTYPPPWIVLRARDLS
jgi:prepilin-type N-terminal cleavage/methylation domain-containing protein